MFHKCTELREANRQIMATRQRLAAYEARQAERDGPLTKDADALLEECKITLRLMERQRDAILREYAKGS
jgi:hypothetical protein